MDKNAIKKYAVWARRELISRVSQKALQYGVAEKNMVDANANSIHGHLLTDAEKKQRQALIAKIKKENYEQVMEEVAYTWFNRFIALRFMEVNGYLPTHVRVFTDEEGCFKPQILTEAIHLEMNGLDMEKVYAYKIANHTDELFKYLIITQCNALSSILPGMFEKIADYTELLFPDNLLREGSSIEQMIAMIPEEDWKDAVQIIGWLYQYYNTEPKDKVFENLKKNIKISKENIPAATQLFTPDWIVRYMVENSLGRLWIEGHPNDEMKAGWKYYLDEAEQEPNIQKELVEIRRGYAGLNPEDIKFIDPCMGSGHILVYAFDVLMEIYKSVGYTERSAAHLIVEKNLYGLDIDDRAYQLAYFAVMMKARQYDRRFLISNVEPNLCAIQESNNLNLDYLKLFEDLEPAAKCLATLFHDAKEYGSILNVDLKVNELQILKERFDRIDAKVYDNLIDSARQSGLRTLFAPLLKQAIILQQKYEVVVTNPPYLGVSVCNTKMNDYIKKYYFATKTDLFAAFMVKCRNLSVKNGIFSMITQHSWMFLKSFIELRNQVSTLDTLCMIHLGARAFEEIAGEVVQTTSFSIRNSSISGFEATYVRLVGFNTQESKREGFLSEKYRYQISTEKFNYIEDAPIAYWVPQKLFEIFKTEKQIGEYGDARVGMQTGENDKFVRLWEEVAFPYLKVDATSHEEAQKSLCKWFPYNKGGEFRKWYGNNDWVVDWFDNGNNIKQDKLHKLSIGTCLPSNSKPKNTQYYFLPSITWSKVASGSIAFRYKEPGHIFDIAGASIFTNPDMIKYIHGYCNSVVATFIAFVLSPTINYEAGAVSKFPMVIDIVQKSKVESLVSENIALSKYDYNSFETSWDFKQHPLIPNMKEASNSQWASDRIQRLSHIELCYNGWKAEVESRFFKLKENEEELNRIFIDIYGLQDVLTPEVAGKDVTVARVFDNKNEIPESMRGNGYVLTKGDLVKSLISYAVGCMLGRYSLDMEGLAYAGGEWDTSKYSTIIPDKDNIVPICDDDYFDDDIVGRFVKFIDIVYGKETLDENLKFIADALGGSSLPIDVIRNYFINDFYADHLKIYQKRPIYWLFDSGKSGGFKALIYMHRYQQDTLARMRTDYVHEQQARYRTAIADLEQRIDGASPAERVKLNKELLKLHAQSTEIREFEEKIHHLADQMIRIDLDDGVKHNYALFEDVLAKIK